MFSEECFKQIKKEIYDNFNGAESIWINRVLTLLNISVSITDSFISQQKIKFIINESDKTFYLLCLLQFIDLEILVKNYNNIKSISGMNTFNHLKNYFISLPGAFIQNNTPIISCPSAIDNHNFLNMYLKKAIIGELKKKHNLHP